MYDVSDYNLSRRHLLRLGAAAGVCCAFPAASVFGKSERPVKIGWIDSLTGPYAAYGQNDVNGAKMAIDHLNRKNGILGRPVQLFVEDDASDSSIGIQKAHKLVQRDHADVLMGTVASNVALAVSQTATDLAVPFLVTSSHADAVTGAQCRWTTFRLCASTWMLTAAIFQTLFDSVGKKWYFITPDYSYGHSLYQDFSKQLKEKGGTVVGNSLAPLGTTNFSSHLIKAKLAHPDVLVILQAGDDLVNALKQAKQFALSDEMAISGAYMNMEALKSLPQAARIGWWSMEWYWKQPNVPHVHAFVEEYKQRLNDVTGVPSARGWFGFAAVHSFALAAEQAKSVHAQEVVKALEGLELPPEVALQPNKVFYRAGDHQLMANLYPGYVKQSGVYPDLFEVERVVPSAHIANSPKQEGCHMEVVNLPGYSGGRLV